MSTKLTLTLDKDIIEKAKAYAKLHERSLSNLIEDYLRAIVNQKAEATGEIPLTPIVKSLKGSVKVQNPRNFDEKQVLEDELLKKYLG
ncbi:MAG: DUF6364 family protein [Bacteroidota bacterium]